MHEGRVAAFDEIRFIAIAREQGLELVVADACKDGRVGDLVSVEIQDRQHGAIARWVDELVGMPRRGERPRLRFSVADDACDDRVGVVERHAIGVGEAVAELTAFVNRPRCFGRHVAPDVTGERELLEEFTEPLLVLALVGIDLGIGPFEVSRPQHTRRPVARPRDEHDVEIVFHDHPVQMKPREGERRAGAPVAE